MTLQDQLRKLTTGGPGVTHIATETLFEDSARRLDDLEARIEHLRTVANINGVRSEEMASAVFRVLSSTPIKGEK